MRVWQRAQELCVEIYLLTADFPPEERYGLTGQLRRAAVSVGSNIAEASRRASRPDKRRILNVAQSEAAELVSELDVACRPALQGEGDRRVPRNAVRPARGQPGTATTVHPGRQRRRLLIRDDRLRRTVD